MEIEIVVPAYKSLLSLSLAMLSPGNPAAATLPAQRHHLVILESGELELITGLKAVRPVDGPALAFIPAGIQETIQLRPGKKALGAVLGFPLSTMDALTAIAADSAVFSVFTGDDKRAIRVSGETDTVRGCFSRSQDLAALVNEAKRGHNALALALTLEIFVASAEALSIEGVGTHEEEKTVEPDGVWTIRRVIDYIGRNYAEAFSLDFFVGRCAMNTSDFSRRFKDEAGCPLFEFINRRRIDRACQLLKYTELPVIDIAQTVGYNNLSFFNRYFQRIMDDSPRSWRAKARS